MAKKATFSDLRSALALPAPATGAATEYAHETQTGFYVRVHKPRADGAVRRVYIARYQVRDEMGTVQTPREPLGLVAALDGTDATPYELAQADALRLVHRARAKMLGQTARITMVEAYNVWEQNQLNGIGKKISADYQEKIRQVWRNFLEPLSAKLMDELDEEFWIKFLHAARKGRIKNLAGKEHHAKSASAALNVINTVALLYKIAHSEKGLKDVPRDWDPSREAARLIEPPNKRVNRIRPEHFPDLWLAIDQLMSPWWRDLFKVYLFTGLRDSLVMDMKWEQIDWDQRLIRIPALSRGTKRHAAKLSQREREEDIIRPLSSEVMRVLESRYRFRPAGEIGEYVWYGPQNTGVTRKRLTDPRNAWAVLEPYLGFTPIKHDLRRTFSNISSSLCPTQYAAISHLMLHSIQTTAAAVRAAPITLEYAGEDLSSMREVVDTYTQGVLELAGVIPRTDLTRKFKFNPSAVLENKLMQEARVVDNKAGELTLPSPEDILDA